MGIIYVARHGETDWNREGRYQGRLESELTELGERQARALAGALAQSGAKRVIASPLRRTVQTARPIAERLDLPLETDDRLLEIGHGSWEGRLRDEIERNDPERMRIWREEPQRVAFEGGESLTDVLRRWQSFAAELHETNAVLVTHDALVRIAILDALGRSLADFWQPRVTNCAYARFKFETDGRYLLDECCDAHLAGIAVNTAAQAL